MTDRLRLFLIAAALTASCTSQAFAATRIAVFGFELVDTSLDGQMRGQNPDEQRRLAALKPRVDAFLAANGNLQPVDITPVRKAAEAQNLQACGGCDLKLAQNVGAALSLTGTVQKISNLILNINMVVRDVATGRVVRQATPISAPTAMPHGSGVGLAAAAPDRAATRRPPAMTRFLASIAAPEEVEIALSGGADLVDLKDPATGALGALSLTAIERMLATIAGRRPVSAVTGDLPMDPDLLRSRVEATAATGVDFVKVGLFPDPAIHDCIRALAGPARSARLVGVLFADRSPDFELVTASLPPASPAR